MVRVPEQRNFTLVLRLKDICSLPTSYQVSLQSDARLIDAESNRSKGSESEATAGDGGVGGTGFRVRWSAIHPLALAAAVFFVVVGFRSKKLGSRFFFLCADVSSVMSRGTDKSGALAAVTWVLEGSLRT
ncbi:hypothetical protein MGYG_08035 [Nannizzia gypsea CBS 118893]|uniref:Uncharacterized protein n=1 Tax=Arthroderma gypseum (strain ATCC MYA-4604 / CBS 118893) TaxID=535722 RepID=E4V4V5_ARTGP|nr:hypothetical protein MGYG_08035 [Nannizzia gypsea CBS 118893]EFR05029.1 hypothetical protein MGYG_08035 [Nannizzia gypsea CBS 118893]